MTQHPSHTAPLAQPAPFSMPKWSLVLSGLAALVGAATFGWALANEHGTLAWGGYLMGAFYVLSLALFGVLWIAILYLAKGAWSVSMRRIPEAMSAFVLPAGLLSLAALYAGHTLYHWADLEVVAADTLLTHKAAFLNQSLALVLVGLSVLLWIVFGALIVGNSRRQDQTGDVAHTRANVRWSALFVIVFAITLSVVSFYLLMSLEAHWFSTMYAVLTFTDLVQTGTAFVTLVLVGLLKSGKLTSFVNENHLHSISKMMFAATGFWAYIYFCQFMLIWYSNIPEETAYFLRRYDNGWLPYLLLLPLFKFAVPFVVLVPRKAKRSLTVAASMAVLLLLAQFWELFLLVAPALGHGPDAAQAHLPWVEFLITLGMAGLFFLVFAWSFRRHSPVPLKDPRLLDCLELHQ